MKPSATFKAMFGVPTLLLLAGALTLPASPAAGQTEVDNDIAYDVLAEVTNEPIQLDVAPDGRIIWLERDGTISVLTPQGVRVVAAELPVAGNLCETCFVADSTGGPAEGGLYSVLLDNDFATNNTLYLYYAVPGTRQEVSPGVFWGKFRLSSFVLNPQTNLLDRGSESEILTVRTEWDHAAHHGGGLEYLPDGTLILTTGDNVEPSASGGYGPRDHRQHWTNGELTSANPADRRGKVLRLREDGSVPDGSLPGEMPNPFLGMEGWNPHIEDSPDNVFVGEFAGTPGDGWIEFDPYVYSLGWKQAWRSMVMPNGDLYVSDIGPDAGSDDPQRGPRGFEELNRVPFGGGTHHGWPRCVGPNWSYIDVDWETLQTNGELDCSANAVVARPIGSSDSTTWQRGMAGADMYYPSGACDGSQNEQTIYDCDQWPIVGSGGKTSEPTALYPAGIQGPLALPERYRDRLLVLEWSRNFILSIPADPATGDLDLRNEVMDRVSPPLLSVNPTLNQPQTSVSAQQGRLMSPIDGDIGPDGALYFLEYGAFFYAGENGRLSRIRGANAVLNPAANYGLPTSAPPKTAVPTGTPLRGIAVIPLAAAMLLGIAGYRRRTLPG